MVPLGVKKVGDMLDAHAMTKKILPLQQQTRLI
jgi:hypothetical protein